MTDSNEYNEAIELLKNKDFTRGEFLKIISGIKSIHQDEYPFIEQDKNHYKSAHKAISHMRFNTEAEVILANAIYENVKDNFNVNEFQQMFKFTARLLNMKTDWN